MDNPKKSTGLMRTGWVLVVYAILQLTLDHFPISKTWAIWWAFWVGSLVSSFVEKVIADAPESEEGNIGMGTH